MKRGAVFEAWIRKRIDKNKNALIIFNGGLGSGKSYGSLCLAHDISKIFGTHFTIKDNLDFDFIGILKKMQMEKNAPAGTAFVLEEVGSMGSGAGAREWQSKANKLFNSFMQTSRHRRHIFIMNCPSFNSLDVVSRRLCHLRFEAVGIDYGKKISVFKPFFLQTNYDTGKIYQKYKRFEIDGMTRVMNRMAFTLPPRDMIREYEQAKSQFTTDLNKEIIRIDDQKKSTKPQLKNRAKVVYALLDAGKNTKEIGEMVGVTRRQVQYYARNRIRGNEEK